MTFRRRLYLILSPDERGGIIERIFEAILILTIIGKYCRHYIGFYPSSS